MTSMGHIRATCVLGVVAFHALTSRVIAFEHDHFKGESLRLQRHLKVDGVHQAQRKAVGDFVNHKAMRHSRSGMRSKVATSQSAILANIQWYMMLFYIIPCCALFLWMIIFRRLSGLADKIKDKQAAMGKLQSSYDGLVGDLESCLKNMTESQVELIQRGFNDLRNDFQDFFEYANRHPQYYCVDTLASLQVFILQWLSVYYDWRLDPSQDPPIVVSKDELSACEDVGTLAKLMVDRLSKCHVKLTTSFGDSNALGDDEPPPAALCCSWMQCCGLNPGFLYVSKPDEDGWPRSIGLSCLGVTLISPKHAILLGAFLMGPFAALAEVGLGGDWGILYAVFICGALSLLLIILVRFEHIDELARLEFEIRALADKRTKVECHHREVSVLYETVTKFTALWQYRSLPFLRFMKAIRVQVRDNPEKAVELLQAANDGFALVEQNLGPKSLWYEDGAPSDDMLKLIRGRLWACERFVSDKALSETMQHIHNIFNPLCTVSVRILAANNLKRGGFWDTSDPYVRVRLGNTEWSKTDTIKNQVNPRWDSQRKFTYTPEIADTELEFEVLDDDSGKDTMLGSAKVEFKDATCGDWVDINVQLQDAKEADLSVQVMRTVDVQAYLAMNAS